MDRTGEHQLKLKLTKFRRPKVGCFLSYVEDRPTTNKAISLKTGHAKGRSHTRGGGV
jgi:hypothetical protein